MKLPIFALMTLAGAATAFAAEPQVGTGETNGYRLVWQDLFDSGQLNTDRWYIEANGDGGGNNELQYYARRDENVRVGDDGHGNGCLIITARREDDYRGRKFTSGRINSRGMVNFTHGKIEAAIRMPKTANGLWPAFWMMGNDWGEVGWPRCGEIDIVEMGHSNGYNGRQETFFNGAAHWGPGAHHSYAKDINLGYSVQDGEFHIWTCIWDENEIAMYIDLDRNPNQQPYYRMTCPDNKPGDDTWPGNYFHKPNFIIFNLAVGGGFPGIYNAEGITALNDGNGQQATMYVNYVKIYQKGGAGETFYSKVATDPLDGGNGGGGTVPDPKPDPDPDPDPNPNEGVVTELAPGAVINGGKISTVGYLVLDSKSQNEFTNNGAQLINYGPGGDGNNLWIWENTFSGADNSFKGVNGVAGDYVAWTVGTVGWSGVGYNCSSADTRTWNDETHFHLAYRSPGQVCPSVGLIVADGGDGSPARVALGSAFVDQGTTYPSVAPAPTANWQGIDMTFKQLKAAFPSFDYRARADWNGNIFCVLAGGTTGQTIAFDGVYFYNKGSSSVSDATAAPWVVTRRTVNVPEADGIVLYDAFGRKIAETAGSVLGIEGYAPGIYVVMANGESRKIAIK